MVVVVVCSTVVISVVVTVVAGSAVVVVTVVVKLGCVVESGNLSIFNVYSSISGGSSVTSSAQGIVVSSSNTGASNVVVCR